jgi:hypothetical protein
MANGCTGGGINDGNICPPGSRQPFTVNERGLA